MIQGFLHCKPSSTFKLLLCVTNTPLLHTHTGSYYFQLLADEAGMARGFLGLMKRFQWKRVGIITQNENLFTTVRLCASFVSHSLLRVILLSVDDGYPQEIFGRE